MELRESVWGWLWVNSAAWEVGQPLPVYLDKGITSEPAYVVRRITQREGASHGCMRPNKL